MNSTKMNVLKIDVSGRIGKKSVELFNSLDVLGANSFINVSSTVTSLKNFQMPVLSIDTSHVGTSKTTPKNFTRGMNKEHSFQGIQANAITRYTIKADFHTRQSSGERINKILNQGLLTNIVIVYGGS